MSEGHIYLNSDNNHIFYNDNDNSNYDDAIMIFTTTINIIILLSWGK